MWRHPQVKMFPTIYFGPNTWKANYVKGYAKLRWQTWWTFSSQQLLSASSTRGCCAVTSHRLHQSTCRAAGRSSEGTKASLEMMDFWEFLQWKKAYYWWAFFIFNAVIMSILSFLQSFFMTFDILERTELLCFQDRRRRGSPEKCFVLSTSHCFIQLVLIT